MQFIYHQDSKKEILKIEKEIFHYLFNVRRHKRDDILPFRNLEDDFIYFYKIEDIKKKEAILRLFKKEKKIVKPKKYFHLIWCVIDPKTIEKTLPILNEIGVSKITFVYCDRSQKNFKIKLDKLKKILINSSQQCGRSSLMEIEICKNLKDILEKNDNITIIDFNQEKLHCLNDISSALIGPEGGFSQEEREMFKDFNILGFDTPLVLKSESAAIAISSKNLF